MLTPTDIDQISRAYHALDVLNNIKWDHYLDQLFALCKKEERQHRHGLFSKFGATVDECAKMFVVRNICAMLIKQTPIPKQKDFLSYKHSLYFTAALVLNYKREIRQALKGFDIKHLASFDYCEVIK